MTVCQYLRDSGSLTSTIKNSLAPEEVVEHHFLWPTPSDVCNTQQNPFERALLTHIFSICSLHGKHSEELIANCGLHKSGKVGRFVAGVCFYIKDSLKGSEEQNFLRSCGRRQSRRLKNMTSL